MLREKGRVKNVLGNTQLELQADANESFRVRELYVDTPSTNYATVRVQRTTAAYMRCGGDLGSHLNYPIQDFPHPNLYNMLIAEGIFSPIPIPSGMKLSIEGVHQANSRQTLVYDVYDAGDVRAEETNGPMAGNYDFIQYCRYNTTLADGENVYDTQQSPKTYPQFPLGKVVPNGFLFTLRGIAFSDYGNTTGTQSNQQRTTYVKLVKDRTVLFDDDRNGFLSYGVISTGADEDNIAEGLSLIGNHSDVDQRKIYLLENPLEFSEGDDVDLIVTTSVEAGTANIAAASAEVGLIFNVRKVS